MYKSKLMVLLICLAFSGAFCYAHGEARTGNFVLRAVVGNNINGYVDQNLTIGNKYWYKVTSYNSDGESAFSPVQVTRPSGRNDGCSLVINRMQFCTSEDLCQVESWIRGVPEIRLRVVRGIPGSQTADCFFTSAIVSPPSRSAIVGQWWYHNLEVINDNCSVIDAELMITKESSDLLCGEFCLTALRGETDTIHVTDGEFMISLEVNKGPY